MPVPSRPSERRRSGGRVDRRGLSWACFLITSSDAAGRRRGHLPLRPADADSPEDEVQTTEIFREAGEGEVQARARALGRPMLSALLASALHVRERERGRKPEPRRWFRDRLTEDARR